MIQLALGDGATWPLDDVRQRQAVVVGLLGVAVMVLGVATVPDQHREDSDGTVLPFSREAPTTEAG